MSESRSLYGYVNGHFDQQGRFLGSVWALIPRNGKEWRSQGHLLYDATEGTWQDRGYDTQSVPILDLHLHLHRLAVR